jgi:hypothetical protein
MHKVQGLESAFSNKVFLTYLVLVACSFINLRLEINLEILSCYDLCVRTKEERLKRIC